MIVGILLCVRAGLALGIAVALTERAASFDVVLLLGVGLLDVAGIAGRELDGFLGREPGLQLA